MHSVRGLAAARRRLEVPAGSRPGGVSSVQIFSQGSRTSVRSPSGSEKTTAESGSVEEMAPEIRGRVNGLFGGFVVLGASVPDALLHPLTELGIGWRGLFWIGAVPLVLLPFYAANLKETSAFLAREPVVDGARSSRSGRFAGELARLRLLLGPAHRRRLHARPHGESPLPTRWRAFSLFGASLDDRAASAKSATTGCALALPSAHWCSDSDAWHPVGFRRVSPETSV